MMEESQNNKYQGDFYIGQKVQYLGLDNPILFIADIIYSKEEEDFIFYFLDKNRKESFLISLEVDIKPIIEAQLSLF